MGALESTGGDQSTLAGDTPIHAPPSQAMQRGDMVGRYLVLSVIGHGAMGVVYSAHDPDLDRKIALKLVTTPVDSGPLSPTARELLLREAQSLARLSHPNVVTVHDVGQISGGIFIAMEYVQGPTLRQWWTETQPGWPRLRDVCVEAGRGLAAAHRAGLVHRDFKPENVMVDEHGHARVLDFGLARPASEITVAISRQGTPAYMAPEALEGHCDARSDQFSFCVTVWELAFGQRPFTGMTALEISSQALAGRVVNPKRLREVPRRIRTALLRGLDPNPHARFASMDALLREFDDEPVRRRRRRVTAAGVTAIAALGLVAWTRERVNCAGERERALALWNAEQRERVATRIAQVAPTYGPDVASRVGERLDAHTLELASALVGACEQRRRGDASETIATVTEVCLEQQRVSLEAVTAILLEVDERTAAASLDVVESLPPVAECSNATQRVEFREGLGDSATDSVRRRLARAGTLVEAGRAQEALLLTEALVEETETLGWPAFTSRAAKIHAIALWDVGRVDDCERWALRAIDFAAQAHDDHQAKQAWIALLNLSVDRGRANETLTLEPAVRSAHLRAGESVMPHLHNAMGSALMLLGRFEEAEQRYQRAIEEFSQVQPLRATAPQVNLAVLRVYQGRFVEARDLFSRATEAYVSWRGPDHPDTWTNRVNLADTLTQLGEARAAAGIYAGAIEAFEAVQGVDSIEAAWARQHLAEARLLEGRLADAERELTRALTVLEQTVGRAHPYTAAAISSRARLHAAQGRADAAEADYRASTEMLVTTVGADHPIVGWNHALAGRFELARGRLDAAEGHLVLAEGPLARYGESNTMLVPVLVDRAAIHLARRELDPAATLLERARRIVSQGALDPIERGRYEVRAGELAALRSQNDAASRHGQAALDAFGESRSPDALTALAQRLTRAP